MDINQQSVAKRLKRETDQDYIHTKFDFSYRQGSLPILPICSHTQQILTELKNNNIVIIQGIMGTVSCQSSSPVDLCFTV